VTSARTTFFTVILDFLTGFVVFAGLVGGFAAGLIGEDLRINALLLGSVFLAAGFARGTPEWTNPWVKGCVVATGFAFPTTGLSISGVAMTNIPAVVVMIGVSLGAAVAGAHLRRFSRRQRPTLALTLAVASIFCVAIVAYAGVPAVLNYTTNQIVNRPAGAFSLLGSDGSNVTADSVRGRVVILEFWATWCTPCEAELRNFNSIYKKYRTDTSVKFIAVNADGSDDISAVKDRARSYFEKRGLDLPVAFASRTMSQQLGVRAVPALVFLDMNENVRLIHYGGDVSVDLEALIDSEISLLAHSARH